MRPFEAEPASEGHAAGSATAPFVTGEAGGSIRFAPPRGRAGEADPGTRTAARPHPTAGGGRPLPAGEVRGLAAHDRSRLAGGEACSSRPPARRAIDWRGWLALAWALWFGWQYALMVVEARGAKARGLISGSAHLAAPAAAGPPASR
jgi:hypothetical protein